MKKVSRRSFIRQSAQTAITVPMLMAASKHLKAADHPNHQMTVDLTPGAIGVKVSRPLELNALAAKHGFTSVAPNLQGMATMADSQLGEMVAQMKRQGLQWGTAGCPVSIRSNESDYRSQLSELPKYSKVLAKVGGTRMNTYIPPSSRDTTYLQNFKLWSKRLREIGKILTDNGQRIGLEYIGTHTLLVRGKYPFIHTMAETKDLIADTGAKNIGFVLDSWHWWQAGDNVEDILTLKGDEIIAVDLNDAPTGVKKTEQIDSQRELPVATGVIDAKAFLTAIKETGFDGPVRAEPFNAPLNKMNDNDACSATAKAIKKAFAMIN
ncbi:sugar phosphate isomerase/epimerase [Verrucomicrobia bacterium]|jgi:sugar phosphate isomerase/epimerase|nr:sugar phosphate isomerase/epimerase [Verrucomicrobiota bacterium]